MSDQFWLSKEQLARIKPYFPLSHGVPRVDDRKVISGIIHVIRNGGPVAELCRSFSRILYAKGEAKWHHNTRQNLDRKRCA